MTASYAQPILQELQRFNLQRPRGATYRSNSPLRAGSDSLAFTVTVDDSKPGGGVWFDHVAGEGGSFLALAPLLGIGGGQTVAAPVETKKQYKSLEEYAQAHGVSGDVFRAAGWGDATFRENRPVLPFQTLAGTRFRYIDGNKPAFKSPLGYEACWYGLQRAVKLAHATGQPVVICNGEPSTVVAQHFGVAAACATGGENKALPLALLDQLRDAWDGEVVVALDCDQAGRAGAHKVAQQLESMGYRVRAVDLEGGAGFDLADFCRLHTDGSAAALQAKPDLGEASSTDGPELARLRAENAELRQRLEAHQRTIRELQAEADSMRERNRRINAVHSKDELRPGERNTHASLLKTYEHAPAEHAIGQEVKVSLKTIADEGGTSKPTVSRHLKRFADFGWIETRTERRFDPETNKIRTEYFITPKVDLTTVEALPVPERKPYGGSKPRCENCASHDLVTYQRMCRSCGLV